MQFMKKALTYLTTVMVFLFSTFIAQAVLAAATFDSGGDTATVIGKVTYVTLSDILIKTNVDADITATGSHSNIVITDVGTGSQAVQFDPTAVIGVSYSGTVFGLLTASSNAGGSSITINTTVDSKAGDTVTLSGIKVRAKSTSTSGPDQLKIVTHNPGTSVTGPTTFMIDTTAPTAPVLAKLTVGQNTPGTNDTITGAAGAVEANATVKFWSNAGLTTQLGSDVSADGTGAFPASSIGDNAAGTIYVTATDAALNQSLSTTVSNDIVAPAAPSVNAVTTPTADISQNISGTAEANSLVTITGGSATASQQLSGGATAFFIPVSLATEATYHLSVTATDAVGNVSAATTADIVQDSTAPSSPGISINSGAALTNNTAVNLTLDATDSFNPIQMKLSNNADLSPDALNAGAGSGTWIPYSATLAGWNVAAGDGTKIVYAQYRDGGRNTTGVVTDSIVLDQTAPTLTAVSITSNNTNHLLAKTGDTATLAFTASEDLAATPTVMIDGHAVVPVVSSDAQHWQATYTFDGSEAQAAVSFTIDFADLATNGGTQVTGTTDSSSVTFDSVAPSAPTVTNTTEGLLTTATTRNIKGVADAGSTVTISGGLSPVSAVADGTGHYAVVVHFNLNAVNTLSITASDAAGNVSTPVTTLHVTNDRTDPTGSIDINGGATLTNTISVNLNLAASDSNGLNAKPVKLSNNADLSVDGLNANSGKWIALTTPYAWTLSGGDGTKTVYVAYKDAAGNVTTITPPMSASITLDTTAPTVASAHGTPDPAKAGLVTVTIVFADANGMDTTVSPIVQLTGIAGSPVAVTQTGYSGSTWTGTATIGSNSEETNATISVSGAKDLAGNTMAPDTTGTIGIDTIAPVISETTAVLTPTNTHTPSYTFTSSEGGSIQYGGSCSSATLAATSGSNVITFNSLADNTYSDCTITVTDAAGNVSNIIAVTTFTVDTQAPTLSTVSIASNNANPAYAKKGNVVTLTFTSDEDLQNLPTVTIDTHAAVVTQNGDAQHWKAVYTLVNSDIEGSLPFTIDYVDIAGNSGTQMTATSDSSTVTFDKTAPLITAITGTVGTTGEPTTVTVTATDTNTITKAQIKVGSGAWQDMVGSGPYIYDVAVPLNDASNITYKVRVYDIASNVRTSTTQTIVVTDNDAPTSPTISINSGALYTGSTTVSLALSATDNIGVTQMQFSDDGSTYSTPITYATSASYVVPSGDGLKTVFVEYLDAQGNVSLAASSTITLDQTAPTPVSIAINAGASFTNSSSVTLTLNATDAVNVVAQMEFSDDNSTYSAPVTYATTSPYALPLGDGTKTVYVKFIDEVGNVSGEIHNSIVFDTVKPTVSAAVTPNPTTNGTVTVTLTFVDSTAGMDSGVAPTVTITGLTGGSVPVNASTGFVGNTWTGTASVPDNNETTTADISVTGAQDLAANVMDPNATAGTVLVDTLEPTLTAVSITSTNANHALARVGDTATLTFTASEALKATPVVTIDGQSASVTMGGDAQHWTATYLLAGTDTEGVVPFTINYMDLADNSGTTVTTVTNTSSVTFDKTVPALGTIIGTTGTTGETTTISLQPTDNIGPVSAQISINGGAFTPMIGAGSTFTYDQLISGVSTAPVTYQVRVSDAAGNTTTSATQTITVTDNDAPTSPIISINDGVTTTSSASVTLSLTVADNIGVTQMQFSDDGGTYSAPETFAATKSYTLPSGDGVKFVFVKFLDAAGNVSLVASSSITLSTPAPASTPTTSPTPTPTPSSTTTTTPRTTSTLTPTPTDTSGSVLGATTEPTPSATPTITPSTTPTTSASASDDLGQVKGAEAPASNSWKTFLEIAGGIIIAGGAVYYLFFRKPPIK